MAVTVEHDKRRKEILEKAINVFVSDGYVNTTFQKIADQSGIARTILYLYFKNKKEIFNYSIKQLLVDVEGNINLICSDKSINSAAKLTKILLDVIKLLEHNQQLLSVILDYLLHFAKEGANPEQLVRRRTVKLRHFLSSIVIEGVNSGELKKVNIKTASNHLYSFIETAIFQLVVLKRRDLNELNDTVVQAVKQYAA